MVRVPRRSQLRSPSEIAKVMLDHFEILGLERVHDLDRERLEARYLELAAANHPDRFVTSTPEQQREAVRRSQAINTAYSVIRDSVRRAEHLLALAGYDLERGDHDADRAKAFDVGQAFLVEMIERREALVESEGTEALQRLLDEVEESCDELLDTAVDALRSGDASRAAVSLARRRYVSRLRDEIEARLDSSSEA